MDDRFNDRLSEYLDDELDAGDRRELETHLATCERCRDDLAALRAVVARARALPDTAPVAGLWDGVARQIGARPALASRPASRRFAFTLPQLVAAGLALMVLSGGTVWLARIGGDRTDFPSVVATDFAGTEIGADGEPAVRPANFADGAYDSAIADLQRALEDGRGRLDKDTIRILEENLQTIDRAITQCREALTADPANVYLNSYLVEARARKLELLRRAAAMVDSRS
jgi:hypothetical protein